MWKMRWFGVVRATENSIIQQSAYEFLLAFYSNYVTILHRFCDTLRYWWKIPAFDLPHHYLAPLLGATPLEFCRDLRCLGLSYGIVCVILCLAILVQY